MLKRVNWRKVVEIFSISLILVGLVGVVLAWAGDPRNRDRDHQ